MKTNRESNLRYKQSWIDFRLDDMRINERIKGKDKKILGRWSRRRIKKEYVKGTDDAEYV